MAPPGKHVMSCFIQYAPYDLRHPNGAPADWDQERQGFGDTVQRTLESFFPGFSDLVIHREIVTPLDIERVVGLSEGNIFAGEFLAPQMFFFRPAPGWNQYRTPIDGYYQCGSGTHPGGCVMGAPGKLASQQILKDVALKGEICEDWGRCGPAVPVQSVGFVAVGNQLIRQLAGGGFEGRIAPINPRYPQVEGIECSNRSPRPAPSTWPSWPSPTNDSKSR